MKIKSIFAVILAAFSLVSCSPKKSSVMVTFDYVENGRLLEVSGKGLYNLTITQGKSLAVFYSIEHCAACSDLKEQMTGYAKKEHVNIYYVDMTHIDKTNYDFIVSATTDANSSHEFPAYGTSLNLPFMHLFAYKGVVNTISDRFIDYLLEHTQTSHA